MPLFKKEYLFYIVLLHCLAMMSACQEEQIDYNTQVKPILNKRCIACHGGVKKQGGFSLLFEEEAKSMVKSGKFGIVEGDVHQSEMIRRLTHHDPEERMPFEADPLPAEEIAILTKWIKQGAKWGVHWTYKSIEQPKIPGKSDWARNEIDCFIEEKAKAHQLEVSPQAEPEVLARRVALDLIGFPANDSVKQNYLKSPSDENYELLVDQLLDSPHFGEKWTSMWLDLARYADTKGYERDSDRNIWRYRDWLIKAFNEDKPYDQFITEQLAGDLIPEANEDQLIATAFHRNTMTNDEGGTDNEEFRVSAVLDRVNTTWEALMSTTFACVQCHSHPYDPFSHEDYYKFMAYFNNTRDNDAFAEYPVLRHFDVETKAKYDDLKSWTKETLSPSEVKDISLFLERYQPSINSLETDHFVNSELADTKWLAMRNNSSARLAGVNLNNINSLIFQYSSSLKSGKLLLHLDKTNGPVIATFLLKNPTYGWAIVETELVKSSGVHDLYFTFESPELKDPMKTGIQFDWFHFNDGKYKNLPKDKREIFWDITRAKAEQTPIMMDNVPEWSRESHMFERGSWLAKGKKVTPGIPKSLVNKNEHYPENRLGLAQWMTNPDHPLTARTIVNRVWAQFFGRGLVETQEDLGSQGAEPSHPELLDFLSYSLIHEDHWSLKKMMKRMVMSATYRQDSKISPEQLSKDEFNIYLARGARTRLSAEQVRDQALAISGIMNTKMYGPSVMPYQPEGVWFSPYNSKKWIESEGHQKYSRALYIFWKRTAPYPSMINFDGVGREVCSARRISTNTPLQALTTLNDSVYVDMARQFARHVYQKDINASINSAYQSAVGKPIDADRQKALKQLYDQAFLAYKMDKEPEIAALSLVTNAIFNLDEVITKN